MKKLTFLVAAIALVGATSLNANAQSNTTQQPQTQTQTQTPAEGQEAASKEQIQQDQLPETIKNSLKSEVYKDWTVSEVYKVPAADQAAGAKETYEILFTNAENKRAIARFNADGTPIKSNSAGATGQAGAGSQQ